MERVIDVHSYSCVAAKLADQLGDLTEFVSGQDCNAELRDAVTGEKVEIVFHEDDGGDIPFVRISGQGTGFLFDKVLGLTIHRLASFEGTLTVSKVS